MRRNLKRFSLFHDYSLFLFVIGIVLYGVVGSPTPDNPGIVELLIAVLFVCSVGGYGLYHFCQNLSMRQKKTRWMMAGSFLFLYGLFIPPLFSLYYGASFITLARDVAGFIFLCLPLFIVPFFSKSEKRSDVFLISLLFIGIFFSIRVLFLDFSFLTGREELLYLANSPLVLFSALYCVLFGFYKTTQTIDLKKSLIILGMFALALLPMGAMYVDFQRASFFALGSGISIVCFLGFIKRPSSMLIPLIILGIGALVFWPYILDIIENILTKTSKVGLNMRYQEAIAVWEHVSRSAASLLFGYGWGADFPSPAVGGLNVAYTHSLLSYMLLKTGLIGLGLTLIYLFFIFEKAVRLVFIEPIKGVALIWPLVIPVMLYASYKSLDYGLILALILVIQTRKVETTLR